MAAGNASTSGSDFGLVGAGASFGAWARSLRQAGLRRGLALVAAIAFAAVVLGHFHDRFWWPPDEGAYAHVAERVAAGEVLNRDVQDIHPGYINLANAAALGVFGHEMLSLRYPLVAMALIGSCLIFLLLSPAGALTALAGSIAFTSLSLVQFLNPTAHWYSLFLFLLIVGALTWLPARLPLRLEVLGFLIVALTLFRQLSGVFVAIGVVTYLLTESRDRGDGAGIAGRVLIAIMATGLGAYLLTKADLVAFVLFGAWPLLALVWAWTRTRVDVDGLLRLGGRMVLGGSVAAAPLIAYHALHGSLEPWIQDTVLAAIGLTDLAFMSVASYTVLPILGLRGLVGPARAAEAVNGAFWLVAFLAPIALGALQIRALARGSEASPGHPLPFTALFYGLVSVHYQIPIYLFYTLGVSVAGLLWITASWAGWVRLAVPSLTLLLAAAALQYQAAQPLSRGLAGTVAGDRIALSPERWGGRVGLHVEPADAALYDHLIATIEKHVAPDEAILALPFSPELYFLSGRRNPFRFWNAALGIRSDAELQRVLQELRTAPPRLVFFRPEDKYNTPATRTVMNHVRGHYDLIGSRGGFEIFRSRAPGGMRQVASGLLP